jgi:ubiquilin
MEDKLLKLTMKQNSGQQFEVSIAADGTTVVDLKKACMEATQFTLEEIRLIYKGKLTYDHQRAGKILKDENTLKDYKIADGDTVHLVKGKTAAGATSTPATTTQATASSVPTNTAAGAQ